MGAAFQRDRSSNEQELKIDIYAYAMTCYEILTRKGVWPNDPYDEVYKSVMQGKRPLLTPNQIPEPMRHLKDLIWVIENGWNQMAQSRPNINEILETLKQDDDDVNRTLSFLDTTNEGSNQTSKNDLTILASMIASDILK